MMVKKAVTKDDKLVSMIRDDTKLSNEVRIEYISLANTFTEEFSKNITLTSIELHDKYGYGIDTWNEFLNYPMVRKYVQGFVKEIISKKADASLITGEGTRDAIGVKKAMDKDTSDLESERFIVFLLPKKVEEVYDYEQSP